MPSAGTRAFMSPDRMRQIDHWIGVPVCWALTVVRRARGVFGGGPARRATPPRAGDGVRWVAPARPAEPPQEVVFVELAEMGTTVLATPALQRLKTRNPDAEVFFLIFKHLADSVIAVGGVPAATVFTIDASSLWTIARDTVRFMRAARRHRIDTAVNLE